MKSRLNRLVLAWLLLGVAGAVFGSLVAFSMTLFMKTVVDAWIIGGFAFLGFIPGLLGACGQRFAGLAGFFGIIIGFLWGIIESFVRKGIIWPVFVYLCFLQAFFLALAIGLIVQVFIKPKPLPANKPEKKKTHVVVATSRQKSIRRLPPRKVSARQKIEDNRIYEV